MKNHLKAQSKYLLIEWQWMIMIECLPKKKKNEKQLLFKSF